MGRQPMQGSPVVAFDQKSCELLDATSHILQDVGNSPGRQPVGGAMPRLVDLSQDIYTGMRVYPGHLKTVVFEHATHEETGERFEGGFSFQTTGLLVNDNGPTHVDSFSHLDPDPSAATIDRMPLELFYGDAICLDVSGCAPRTDI